MLINLFYAEQIVWCRMYPFISGIPVAWPKGQRVSVKYDAQRPLSEGFCTEQKNSGMEFGSMSL